MKKWTAMLLMLVMLASTLVGCTPAVTTPAAEATAAPEAATEAPATEAPAKDVNLSFFTGKVETIDLLDQIIADYNAQSNGIIAEQEYQQAECRARQSLLSDQPRHHQPQQVAGDDAIQPEHLPQGTALGNRERMRSVHDGRPGMG